MFQIDRWHSELMPWYELIHIRYTVENYEAGIEKVKVEFIRECAKLPSTHTDYKIPNN